MTHISANVAAKQAAKWNVFSHGLVKNVNLASFKLLFKMCPDLHTEKDTPAK